jgi:GxxExxY protein
MNVQPIVQYPHRETTWRIIQCAIEVHRALGPGLLESAYCACLQHEFSLQGLKVDRECPIAVEYKGLVIEAAYRADFLIEDKVLVEVKSVERVESVHEAQALTYMKLRNVSVGLLLNFNVPSLRQGIRRFVRRVTD